MITTTLILKYLGILLAAVVMIFVLRWRRRTYREFVNTYAEHETCEHLQPALQHLQSQGHSVVRAGQMHQELPLEIHISPPFDPRALADTLKLEEPVFVSERNVLFCQEHACELHPAR
jgi:hypothetical protein